ncbi:MAG: hypothetical protein IT233_14100 [Bacteroidia bacterium]|nr:hypothetical protein [Bacteroidia bacterium]
MNKSIYFISLMVAAFSLSLASQDAKKFKRFTSLTFSAGVSISDAKIKSPQSEIFQYWPTNEYLYKVSEKRGRIFPKTRMDIGVQYQLSKSAAIAFSIGQVSTVFLARIKEFYPTQDYYDYAPNHSFAFYIAANDTFILEEVYGISSWVVTGSCIFNIGSSKRHFLGAGLRYNRGYAVFAQRTYENGYVEQSEEVDGGLDDAVRPSVTLEYRYCRSLTECFSIYLVTEADYNIDIPWIGDWHWYLGPRYHKTNPDVQLSHIVGLSSRLGLSFNFR